MDANEFRRKQLRTLARVTGCRGDWEIGEYYKSECEILDKESDIVVATCSLIVDDEYPEDSEPSDEARYIAAASPAAVLTLFDDIDTLQARAVTLEAALHGLLEWQGAANTPEGVRVQNEAFRALASIQKRTEPDDAAGQKGATDDA